MGTIKEEDCLKSKQIIQEYEKQLNTSDTSESIKHIIKKTHYWLFKKTSADSNYYFVRTITEGLDRVVWFIGKENHFGLVSSVGGELSEEKQKQLESEFQSS